MRARSFFRSVIISWLLLLVLGNVLIVTVWADGWKASDDGNDNPDGLQWWFAPRSIKHRSAWWDVDQVGAMDQVYDSHLRWTANIQANFQNQPDRNIVHEVRTGNDVYEAANWYVTNLPEPDHVEDSNEIEEQLDHYEEMELGWADPSSQIPGAAGRFVYTGYNSLNDGNSYFEIESELTRPGVPGDDWWPERQDILGRMEIQGAH